MNAVQAFLDEFSFPWRSSMAELTARYGIATHPAFDWDVVLIDERSVPFPGMIYPIHANAFRVTSEYPTDYYSTHIWVADDPLENLRSAEAFISGYLGPASPRSEGRANEYTREWVQGPAAIRLDAVPDSLRPVPITNPTHGRDPRLKTGCSISVYPGYRPALSAAERAWVTTAHPSLSLHGDHLASSIEALNDARPSMLDVEFARDPIPECEGLLGTLGISADGDAMVVCGRIFLVIPLNRVLRVEVDKLYPARGPGGSWAKLVCMDPQSDDGEKSIALCHRRRPDELDEFAARLAAQMARPVVFNRPTEDA